MKVSLEINFYQINFALILVKYLIVKKSLLSYDDNLCVFE